MFRYCLLAVSLLACSAAQAQMSLSDQIASVKAVQDNERARQQHEFARQQSIQRAAMEQAAQVAAQQQAASLALERQRIAGQVAVEQQRLRMQSRQHEEAIAAKKRDEDYEDQLRSVQVDHAKLQLLEEQQKITSDKQRDQAYQDKLREVELQQKMLELKRAEIRVSRENDIIDHDLRHQDAQTDVVQSSADATRNVSEGAKSFMQGLGTAAVRSQNMPAASVTMTR